MTTPSIFEDEQRNYLVLRNNEGQYSLWPTTVDVPAGWQTESGPGSRSDCRAHIEQHG